ncbi:MAG: putative capsular polysaccharide synthesis family protein [Bacteroidota bacterium]
MKRARNWGQIIQRRLAGRLGVRRPAFVTFVQRCHDLPPLYVYQMGKVASSSLRYSLEATYPGQVVHSHHFGPQHRKWEVEYLYRAWQKGPFPLKVISLIREPVGRNISAFFENFERFTRIPFEQNPYTAEELQLIFLTRYAHNIPLLWLESELQHSFGVDVYASPFPREGHLRMQQGPVDFLLMKHQLTDEYKAKLVQDFVPLEQLEWHNRNQGTEKPYAQLYQEFKALPLPDWYLDQMYNSRYARHFYGDEIESLRQQWSGR